MLEEQLVCYNPVRDDQLTKQTLKMVIEIVTCMYSALFLDASFIRVNLCFLTFTDDFVFIFC